jgi:hypothetical protein
MQRRVIGYVSVTAVCFIVIGPATRLALAGTDGVSGITIGGSSQAVGESDQPYLGPGFGGTTWSSIAFGEAVIRQHWSVGGEASINGSLTGEQFERVSGGANQLMSRHRDSIFSAIVKVRSPPASRFQVAAGGGAGLAWRHTIRVGHFAGDSSPAVLDPVTETLDDAVPVLTGAVDAVVRAGDRLGIVALIRLHKLEDEDRLPDGVVKRGVSSLIVQYGAGVQIQF